MNLNTRLSILITLICLPFTCHCQTTGYNALIMEDSTYVRMRSTKEMQYSVTKSIMVMNEDGAGIADFIIYTDPMKKLSRFKATISDTTGQEKRKFGIKDVSKTEISNSIADDNVINYLQFKYPQYPYIVDIEYQVSYSDGYLSMPVFYPLDRANVLLNKASYTIEAPDSSAFVYACKNCNIRPSVTVGSNTVRYTWRTGTVLPVKPEPYMHRMEDLAPQVWFAPRAFKAFGRQGDASSWNSYALWQWPLLKERSELPQELRQKAIELTSGLGSKREKVEAIYKWLGENTRYVSIQLGIGGFQPMAPEKVYSTRFGDCKALSNLMRTMLEAVGIESNYVEIGSGRSAAFAGDIAALGQTNHVIVKVPDSDGDIWLECTNTSFPVGYVHSGIAGHNAVVYLNDGSAAVETLPHGNPQANYSRVEASVNLNHQFEAAMEVHETYSGLSFESHLSLLEISADKLNSNLLASLSVPMASMLGKADFKKGGSGEFPWIKGSYKVNSSKYGTVSRTRVFIPSLPFRFNGMSEVKADRVNEIHIANSTGGFYSIRVNLPDNASVESLPKEVNISNGLGRVAMQSKMDGNTITIDFEWHFERGDHPSSEAPALKELADAINTCLKSRIILVNKDA